MQDMTLNRPTSTSLGIDEFLYREASLLDEDRYTEWMDLLTDDVTYYIPQTEFVDRPDSSLDYLGAHHFDEDRTTLQNRIDWLQSGMNSSESARSQKTRSISNIRLLEWDNREAKVASNFSIWQSRWDGSSVVFVGKRVDTLRQENGEWKIARREARLNSSILPRALTIFI